MFGILNEMSDQQFLEQKVMKYSEIGSNYYIFDCTG